MGGTAGVGGTAIALQRRKELGASVKSGAAGLIQNRQVFAITVFASLGGLLYGYNQGVFSSVLAMYSFKQRMASDVLDPDKQGWMVAILELGAWFGALCTGVLVDLLSRKYTIVLATIIFCIGVVVQTSASAPPSIYGGRFIVGMGVGSLSMAVPLYNAELAPPEIRGSLVALQQLAITFGIMISYWIDLGTNHIGGTGETQKEAAWRLPLGLQLAPAVVLGVGILFQPFSPRWLVNKGRDEEAQQVLSNARKLPIDHELIILEYKEIKAQHLFDVETAKIRFPEYQDGSWSSSFKLGVASYISLFKTKSLFYRVAIGSLTMFFQQWSGVNGILYYAPTIFKSLGLTDNSTSLLATGVVGVAMFLATIPAVLWVDGLGRKPVLVSGAFVMAACHFIVGALTATYRDSWDTHASAGWAACAFVWIFAIGFGYSWGPCAWIIVAEIWPLSVRGKGLSIATSSNWMNNFIVGQVTPTMITHLSYGTFIFFGSFAFLGGLFVLFFVPETKGVSLEEMEEVFGGSKNLIAEDQAILDKIYQDLGLTEHALYHKSDEENSSDKGSNEKAEKE
ncbi:general substrate transporter [Flagelloscypha sp. PMI_526]|nr:general substrate transporter [Flagelloscypha sp. PMI_526]